MRVKQSQINRAYKALEGFKALHLSIREAHGVYMLLKAIEPHFQFAIDEERKLMEKHHATFAENGGIAFDSHEAMSAFQDDINEMGNLGVDINVDPVTISFESVENERITPTDIMNLDGFIRFE